MGHRVKSGKDIWGVQRGAPQQGPFLGWGGCTLPALLWSCFAALLFCRDPGSGALLFCRDPGSGIRCFAKIKIFLGPAR